MTVGSFLDSVNPFKKVESVSKKPAPTADAFSGYYSPLFTISYNGEKDLGEIGPIKNYVLDYQGLRARSWASFLTSEVAQTIINRYTTWVIGKGLKLQVELPVDVLESEGITVDQQNFSKQVESRFALYRKSKMADYSNMVSLDVLEERAFKNSIIGGDVLVVLRYVDNCVKVQLIDGAHVMSPLYGTEWFPMALSNGNKIVNGIEISATREHVAYFVRKSIIDSKDGTPFEIERIPARGVKSGLQMAFLVSGLDYRIDNLRSMPLLSAVLETVAKLERYKEAMVGSAEETAKVAYQVVHQAFSTGESPLAGQLARAFDLDKNNSGELPIDIAGRNLANLVGASTNKQTFNNPQGAEIKTLDYKNQLHFKEFYEINTDILCAAVEIPPNVAMSKFNDSFSASRAALKDWEHTLHVKRARFSAQFTQIVYAFWLETEILKGTIQAPGYLIAKSTNNYMVIQSYRCARFVGPAVPHIDPLKEVMAEREKLGLTGVSIPFTTAEAATERLNEGEYDSNLIQYAKELEQSKKLKVAIEEPVPVIPPKNS